MRRAYRQFLLLNFIALLLALLTTTGMPARPLHAERLTAGHTDPSVPVYLPMLTITNFAALSRPVAGRGHTCSLTTAGGVLCWGANAYGQLGDGSTQSRLTPTPVSGLARGVTALVAGYDHTCALTTDGGVLCWGLNATGQLGDGGGGITCGESHEETVCRLTPVAVVGLPDNPTALATGNRHTCALTDTGAVLCWGANWFGQLGDGTTENRLTPTPVTGLASGVTALAAGWSHTCVLTTAGEVLCWGTNDFGQVGDGTIENRLTPTPVSGLSSGVTALTASWSHTCALAASGGALCWGYNGNGQLGDGTTEDRRTPVAVSGLSSGIVALTAGYVHTCARMADGRMLCWGANGTLSSRLTPVNVGSLSSGVTALAADGAHTCALTTAGGVRCWGHNSRGQLGDGSISNRFTPVPVTGLTRGVIALAAGEAYTCALTAAGAVFCWGYNGYGQLGDGTTEDRLTPTPVTGLSRDVIALAAGYGHTCAVTTTGKVLCWGFNYAGQLGDGATEWRHLTPVPVPGLSSDVTALAAGLSHTCALTTSGGVLCWGSNGYGQLGDGTTESPHALTPVTGLTSSVTAISAGDFHTCALSTDRGVVCWGYNGAGQLGNGTTEFLHSAPVPVTGLASGVTGLTAGWQHTCALTTSGGVKCWGENWTGQLGDGTTIERTTPVDVVGLTSVVAISAGTYHTCALTTAGGVKCWGYNGSGQLGDGTSAIRTTPTDAVDPIVFHVRLPHLHLQP